MRTNLQSSIVNLQSSINKVHSDILNKLGHRGGFEMEVSSSRYYDDPAPLKQILEAYLIKKGDGETGRRGDGETGRKFTLESLLIYALETALRRLYVYRERIKDELIRFNYLTGRTLRTLGQELGERGVISHVEDIFHLTFQEVMDLNLKRGPVPDYTGRKKDYTRAKVSPYYTQYQTAGDIPIPVEDNIQRIKSNLRGIGVSPGVVTGKLETTTTLESEASGIKRILIAPTPDPNLIRFFPEIDGLIIEQGGYLSHLAVVARELGMPLIVGAKNQLMECEVGDIVEMDGSTGIIRIIT